MSIQKDLSYTFFYLITSIIFYYNFFESVTYSQTDKSLDSLFKIFVAVKSGDHKIFDETLSSDKCGLNIISQVKLNFNNFNSEQKVIIKSLLSRPVLQTSIVSPSGFFRIHYDETGVNTPAYVSGLTVEQNVAEVAITLDSVYRFEINYLGFLVPPPDNGTGGDDKYDVYIVNQPSGLYGYTEIENKVGATNWTSFIVIDNDYVANYSTGVNGMRVTVAHEFHHSIQLGNYAVLNSTIPYRNSDIFFYELTSTAMEEFVYDDVNDYYAYMSSYFVNPGNAFPSQNGYNLAIWNIFIKDNFGYFIIKRQWELIPNVPAILAIDQSLNEVSTSFPKELNKFGIWTYFTNSRAIPGIYFEEASNYPLITITLTTQFISPSITTDQSNKPTTNEFIKINLPTVGDFFIAIITNGDAIAANGNPNQLFPFNYQLYDYNEIGSIPIVNNYYYAFNVSSPGDWRIEHIFNDIAGVDEGILVESYTLSQNYPNPFNPSTVISYRLPVIGLVTIKVYDILGGEVATLVNEEKPAGEYEVEFDAEHLSSGIYYYQLKVGQYFETKKMLLLK